MRLVLLGPPGAGKGTQAKRLSKDHGLVHVATGDIFRWNVKHETELGKIAQSYMEKGDLVPDDVVVRMVVERLERIEGGFILDGFPRTVPQALALEENLEKLERPLTAAVYFHIEEEIAVKRISGRRSCSNCGTPYNVEFDPPRVERVCDVCGGELVQRADDREDTVRRRFEVYEESTMPLRRFYAERGLLREIDADGEEEEVARRLEGSLDLPAKSAAPGE
ncbi:MAG TPA: adenylate kinase [Actinomycetota bacterium]|nr:adenylate kinase [Actinomycetota bacterium]